MRAIDNPASSNSDKQAIPENKMGFMPVNRLLISMSLPMIISMIVQSLYNIVDSLFVSRICEDALTAVSLAFPIQMLFVAIVGGTGIGVGTVLSHALGEKKFKKVSAVANTGIFIIAVYYLFFIFVGLFIAKPFYVGQTHKIANPDRIISYGIDYLSIIMCASAGVCMQFIYERLLISTGKSMYSMITQSLGAIINTILDPIFIFGININGVQIVPRLEVKGAAIATVTGQTVAGLLALYFNLTKNKEIQFHFKSFRPEGYIITQIYRIGFPTIIMQAIGSIMVFGFNVILGGFNSTAIAVFGVYFKLQSFFLMPIFGLNNGMVPIIAYNFGAQHKKRITSTFRHAVIYAMSIMFLGFLSFQIFPSQLLDLFDASDNMKSIGIPALRIIGIHYLMCGFCIVGGSLCQALGKAYYSMIISIARQLVVLLPSAYLLSLTGKVNNIWWSFPIAEVISLLFTSFFVYRTYKKIIKPIRDE